MAYKVKVTERASRDVEEYVRFILERSEPEVAERWLNKLDSGVRSLQQLPERFPVIPEADGLRNEYRQFLHYSHRVTYRIDDEANTVFVVRIYHGARRPLSTKDL